MFDKMKQIAVTTCLSMVALGLLNQQTVSAQTFTPASVGLVSWWSGDGNALDSRWRYSGTLRNGATATFDGTLTATLIDGFNPTAAQSFQVLTFGSRTGMFAAVTGPFTASYSATDVDIVSTVTNILMVTNTNDSGAGSLRQAILDANTALGTDTITFNVPGTDTGCDGTTHVCTITPVTQLPLITSPVVLDGYTQPGSSANTLVNGDNAVLLIEISGATLGFNGNALMLVDGAGGSTIRGLVIDQGWNIAILVQTDTVSVEGCFLGTNPAGATASGNFQAVKADFGFATSGMRVGGTTPAARNVISGNGVGIFIRSGTNQLVQGNFIGTNKAGTAALANTTAVEVRSSVNLIGGTTAAARNIIAGNGTSNGINVTTDAVTPTGNRIQGNFIGTDVTGTTPLGFTSSVLLSQSSATQIGGLTATPGTPPGNVISGSSTGILFQFGSSNNTIQGNLIGTNASGTSALGNSVNGINVRGAFNVIGGTDVMARNVISGNGSGISLGIDNFVVENNLVQGNFIGTDISGTQLLGNVDDGVFVTDSINNTIGGVVSTAGAPPGNLIAGNGGRGVGVGVASNTKRLAVLGNSIFSNGGLGIDLNRDGVTPNDPCDPDPGPNNLQNFPVLTINGATLSVTLNSTANTTFNIDFYSNSAPDSSGFGEGETFLRTVTVTTDANCTVTVNDVRFLPSVPAGRWITATAVDSNGNTSEFSQAVQLVAPTSSPATISGTVTGPDGSPLGGVVMRLSGQRSAATITNAAGNYHFDNVDTDNFYTVTPSRANYHFAPASRSFSLLANKTDAVFTATPDVVPSANAIDTPEYFVRQHYLDFLGREPDESGFNFWSDQITSCGSDFACAERRRINVSAAYFLSIEFQQTGGLVDGLYRASYGRRPSFIEFMPDTASIAQNVIVGRGEWQQQLSANKAAFIDAFVQRPAFRSVYDNLANDVFVNALIANTGVNYSQSERAALVSGLTGGTLTRAAVLRQIVENERFMSAKFNEAFVLMQYFGYLRRDPDESGYQFWLAKLNQFGGNFEQAEMVKAFIDSGEYRQRFGP